MNDLDWIGYRLASNVGLGLVLLIVVVGFLQLGVFATLISVVCLALPAAIVILDRRMPGAFALIFVIAAILSAAGWAWDLYRFKHFDGVVHIFATMAMTLFVTSYLYGDFLKHYDGHPWLFMITIISIGTAIGAGWEIIEYFFLPAAKMDLYDTITDILTDVIGAILAVPFVRWGVRQRVS